MHDYYAREKNIGLAPIVITLSVLFAAGFYLLYTFCGKA